MKLYILIFILFIFNHANGQEDMTLQKAISLGLENNYNIKIADTNIAIAENNNTWAKAGKSPTIDLVGGFNNNLTDDNNPASFLQGTFYNGSLTAGLEASWVIYNGGRIKLNKEQLEMSIQQQLINKDLEINNLISLITEQYNEVLFQKEQYKVLESSKALSESRLEYEIEKKNYGASNTYNILQFENAVLSDSTSMITQLQRIETAERNLNRTLNVPVKTTYTYNETLSVNTEEIDYNKLETLLFENNYTLKSLDLLTSLSQLNTKIQRSLNKPTLSLNGNVGAAENGFKFFADNPQTGEPFKFQESNRYSGAINLLLRYNLIDGGARKTDLQTAQLQEEVSQLSFLQARAELNNQLDLLVNNHKRQIEILLLLDKQIALAQRNLDITEERFKAGQVTSIDFRNIQTQYIATAFDKVNAIYNLLLTKNDIDFLVGSYQK